MHAPVPGLSAKFAFTIGGETRPGRVNREHVAAMAQQLGMRPEFVLKQAVDLARKMPSAVEQAMEAAAPNLPHGAKDLAERLKRFVLSTTKKTAARLAE